MDEFMLLVRQAWRVLLVAVPPFDLGRATEICTRTTTGQYNSHDGLAHGSARIFLDHYNCEQQPVARTKFEGHRIRT